MIRIMKYTGADTARPESAALFNDEALVRAVDAIIEDVRREGDAALLRYAARFDASSIDALEVPFEALERAAGRIDRALEGALRAAAANIEAYHSRQLQAGFIISEKAGVTLGQRVMPLDRVGLYVPGGTARYPSSVLMNAVPARLAGVPEIIMITPPDANGQVPDLILAAAHIAGVTRAFISGGAQAVAALAYGTESIPAVDKIVGPGNIYVALAKRRLYGVVDIDMIAGPSEILIIADGHADARHLAADMLSQAEHDALASAALITDDDALAHAVQSELERQLPRLPRADIARASIDAHGWIMVVPDMGAAVDMANAIAPEHLELCVEDPFALLGGIRHAGSVFLGRYAPEALGDYWAGPNHTLPTGGTARFASPLSVDDFVKKSAFIHYTREALAAAKDDIVRLAEAEGLGGHAQSVRIRFEEGGA